MKHKVLKNAAVLLCMIGLVSFQALAQRQVTGKITDGETGEGVPGASVIIKGTTTGTITDFDGNFSINASDDATLVISYVGYESQEVTVGARSVVDVQLSTDLVALSEIVVVGYGTQDKKEITSSVVALDEADFNQGNINDPTQLLQGKVPGLSLYNRGGDPNGQATIRLRGISTVGANAEPLVVIDGVLGASLNNVDPSDIESINVLKDGSAAAIYGSRGSSGVILVTTKQGKSGDVKVNYGTQLVISGTAREHQNLNAEQFVAAGKNDLGSATNWYDEVTRTAASHVHNLSVAGGAGNTTYRVSTNFRGINGVLENSGFDQFNARANLNTSAINDKLRMSFNYSITNRESQFAFNEALRYAVFYNPTAPVNGTDPRFGGYFEAPGLFDSFNPEAILDQNQNFGTRKELNFGGRFDYDIIDPLTVTVNWGRQVNSNLNSEYYSTQAFFRGNATSPNNKGLARRTVIDTEFDLLETYATYTNTFGNTNFTFTGGYSFQEQREDEFYVELGGFPNDDLGVYGLQNARDLIRSGGTDNESVRSRATPDERIIAFFGRANVTFDNAIFVNASIRREGSTKLGEDNRWGWFPAAGVGVDLLQYVDLGPLDQMKIRAGYGVTGSLPTQSGLSQDRFDLTYTGDDVVPSLSLGAAANPDLQWEQKKEFNLGFDFGTGRLTGALDLYTRRITDFILERDVDPAEFGTDKQFQNAGELKTNGLELSLNYDVINNTDFSYNTGIVLSTYKTTLEEFIIDEQMRANLGAPGQNGTNMVRVAVGEEIGQIWGPRFSGQVDERGQPIMVDLNGDGRLNTSQDAALAEDGDFEVLGAGLPDLELGWTNQASYKNWDFNVFFRGAFGHSLVNTFRAFYEPRIPGQAAFNLIDTDLAIEELTTARFSSLYVEKGNFFKLDNMTIGYNFDMSNSNAFANIRAYVSAQNLFVITDYEGLDPEPQLTDPGPVDNGNRLGFDDNGDREDPDVLSPGIDRRNNYFTSRTFTLGFNFTF